MSLNPKSYKDKVVWITGASSGIGAALASAFAAREATLVLSARRGDRLEAVRTACAHAERHRILPLDLTETAAIPTAADSVLSQQGRVDILVNNGGITQRSLVKDTCLEVDRRIMETNYFGAVALTKAVLPSMLGTPERRYRRHQQLDRPLQHAASFRVRRLETCAARLLRRPARGGLCGRAARDAGLPRLYPHRDFSSCVNRRRLATCFDGCQSGRRHRAGEMRCPNPCRPQPA